MNDINGMSGSRDGVKRIVVVGGGFAGLNFVKHIDLDRYSVTLIDKHNFHCFPPLFYQVASAGLDPASICFPLRRELRKLHSRNVMFNMGEVKEIDMARKRVMTNEESVDYDVLVIAAGTSNNFFNMPQLEKSVYTLKSTSQALRCRNDILDLLEKAALVKDEEVQRRMLDFVVVGGGPTGVEIAGAIGEMKRYVLPREYPTIPQENLSITLIEGSDKLLGAMSETSSRQALRDLDSLMVKVRLGAVMKGYEGGMVTLLSGEELPARMVIWTAGVTGVRFDITGCAT
ncbi:MAG: FAD-dependent oxidoreductase, partial [Muribaculaceae bacterium]|nr:FAD-dependent oxidoreductase [Muribaculaceae bacterium]